MSTLSERLRAARVAGGFDPALVDRLGETLASAPEEDVFRMSPLRWAAANGVDERTGIDLFLHATHAGALEFSWGVLCSGCRSFITTPGGLRALREERLCGFCGIPVPADVEENVEVGFSVAPPVRPIRFHNLGDLSTGRDALIGFFSPSVERSAMHEAILAGVIGVERFPSGATREVRLDLPPARYVFMTPRTHGLALGEAREGAPDTVDVDLFDGRIIPDRIEVSPGGATLRVTNKSAHHLLLLTVRDPLPPRDQLGEMAPPEHDMRPYLSGKRLITSQAFRDLFRAESIPSDGGLELKNLTVLFTDLKGSTEIYERVGDLRAYDLVRRHFTVLREAVAASGGSVVKTIGDAIMASFADSEAALRAAVAMRRQVRDVGDGALVLKIGLHGGPCIAVELNDRLDYFGRTVNVAARVQGIAEADEIVVTEPIFHAPGVEAFVRAAELSPRPDRVHLKGIEHAVDVVRLGG